MRVRAATAADRAWIAALLESFGWDVVALRGELFRALDHPMLVAESDGGPEGLLTYILRDGECEILTLEALRQWAGVRAGAVVEFAAPAQADDPGGRRARDPDPRRDRARDHPGDGLTTGSSSPISTISPEGGISMATGSPMAVQSYRVSNRSGPPYGASSRSRT